MSVFSSTQNIISKKKEIALQNIDDLDIFDQIPDGWQIDINRSPTRGFIFINNKKSVLNGQKIALLRTSSIATIDSPKAENYNGGNNHQNKSKTKSYTIHSAASRPFNELARKRFQEQILKDILIDLTICEIEGWCKQEYIDELKKLINSIGKQTYIEADISEEKQIILQDMV